MAEGKPSTEMENLDNSIKLAEDEIKKTGVISRKSSVNRSPPVARRQSIASESPEKYEGLEAPSKRKRATQANIESSKKRDQKEVAADQTSKSPEEEEEEEKEEKKRRLEEDKRLTKIIENLAKAEEEKKLKEEKRRREEAQNKAAQEEKRRQEEEEKRKKENENSSGATSSVPSAGVFTPQVSDEHGGRNSDPKQTKSQAQNLIQTSTDTIKDLKKQIREAVTRTTPEGRGKIAFATKEQKTVLSAMDEITNIYTDILTLLLVQETEINKLQKENFDLKQNDRNKGDNSTTNIEDKLKQVQTKILQAIKDNPQPGTKTLTQQIHTATINTSATPHTPTTINDTDFPALGQKTYAQLAKRPTNTDNKDKKPWTTPEPYKKFDTVIKLKEGQQGDTLTELKKIIKAKDIEGTQIRHTRTAIVLTSQSKDKQDEILRRTQTSTKLDSKDGTRHNEPTIILTGIRKALTHDEITDGLKLENDDLDKLFGDRLKLLNIVSTRPCRNPYKENVYLRGPTDIIKHLLKSEKIYLDFQTIYVNEATQLALCFRCCRYGHVAKHCKETTPSCYKCGDGHDGNTCDKDLDKYNCTNCERLRLTPRRHQARDTNCPIYIRKLVEARAQTQYN